MTPHPTRNTAAPFSGAPLVSMLLAGLLSLGLSSAQAWPGGDPAGALFPGLSTDCEDLSEEPITYGMQYDLPGSGLPDEILDVHDIWLAGGCVGCHNQTAMGGLRLDTPDFAGYELVLASSFRNGDIFRVVPNKPESSLLYAMLNCVPPLDYPYMPPPTDVAPVRISARLRAMVYDWIAQGARGHDAFGFPYSDVVFRDSMESSRLQSNVRATPRVSP